MSEDNIILCIDNFNAIKNALSGVVRKYVTNKDIPLENRWNVFSRGEFGIKLSYIHHFKGKIDLCDLYDYDRHTKVYTVDEVNILQEELDWCIEKGSDYKFSQSDINELKEEILDEFLFEFEIDW